MPENNYPDPTKIPPELQEAWQAGYDEWMKKEAFERGMKAAEEEIARKFIRGNSNHSEDGKLTKFQVTVNLETFYIDHYLDFHSC